MTPERKPKKGHIKSKSSAPKNELQRIRRSPDDEHEIAFFEREGESDPAKRFPGEHFLYKQCPESVRQKLESILMAVAKAPPKKFAGGGAWEAMHGEMSGWFEVRANGSKRRHYRLFCRLDYEAIGEDKPLLVVITGMSKLFKTQFSNAQYAKVRALGDEYFSKNPR